MFKVDVVAVVNNLKQIQAQAEDFINKESSDSTKSKPVDPGVV